MHTLIRTLIVVVLSFLMNRISTRLKTGWPEADEWQMPPNPKEEEEMGTGNILTLRDQKIECLHGLFIFF